MKQSRVRHGPLSARPSRETREQVTSLRGKAAVGVPGDQGARNGTGLTCGVGGGSWRRRHLRTSWVGEEAGGGGREGREGNGPRSLEPKGGEGAQRGPPTLLPPRM